jgi:putative zinc finger/helix-turn-helix YgiT family protein
MKCPTCGSERWERGTTPEELSIEGRTFKAELCADVCQSCGEALVTADELGRFEVAVAVELARGGARSGEAIKFMRKAIGLRAAALAELLDIAPETLSRWETGAEDRTAPRAYVVMLEAVVLEHAAGSSATLDRLRVLREVPPALPSAVRIELGTAA